MEKDICCFCGCEIVDKVCNAHPIKEDKCCFNCYKEKVHQAAMDEINELLKLITSD